MPKKSTQTIPTPKLKFLQNLSLWFFRRPRKTALIWLIIAIFGLASYATLLKREGFPAVASPFATGTGTYLVNNPAKVDSEVVKPISDYLVKQDAVNTVLAQSFDNFYNVTVLYETGVDAKTKSQELTAAIKPLLPPEASFQLESAEFGFTLRGDEMVVSFYDEGNDSNTAQLIDPSQAAAKFLSDKNLPLVQEISTINPFETTTDPSTGETNVRQKTFDRYGKRADDTNRFYTSVVIGVQAEAGADNLELDDHVRGAVAELNKQPFMAGYQADISASNAPSIRQQIDELQHSLFVGLLAVLVVGSLVIAIRASLITVLSMITVIAAVNGLLYLIGYSLNTITLFAMVLGLALIVDDTIIMVEALDKQRRKYKEGDKIVTVATGKVGRAMIAATSTAVLSFAPLLFVGGILGSFIRAIPVTIISGLLLSLVVALVFIPLFARYLLFGKKQVGAGNVHEFSAGIEDRIAQFVAGPMLWAKGSTKKLFLVGGLAVFIGLSFIGAAGMIGQKVKFNIFPPTNDSNMIGVQTRFHGDTDIDEAQTIAADIDAKVADKLGNNFVQGTYYGQGTNEGALLFTELIDYNDRQITAPQIIADLNQDFKDYPAADVKGSSIDVGPPAAVFTVQIKANPDRTQAKLLAEELARFLREEAELKRPDGSIAKFDKVDVGTESIYVRNDGEAYVVVNSTFVDTDVTTLVTLAEKAIKDEFTSGKLSSMGLPEDSITFNKGQEEENQESFKTLSLAFPLLLVVIYGLLAFQFRSLLQPLLIFMAIPFSLFGITLGLYATENAFSFFAMLGFFALIGLSIKNTILLTDYANQARKAGMGTIDSVHEALAERFRPLIATSFTAVVSLIPLTLSSPFWESLGVVLIFGLLSSTFLVITVFPYYYLGAEYLRQHTNRRTGVSFVLLTIVIMNVFINAAPKLAILSPLIAAALVWLVKKQLRRRQA